MITKVQDSDVSIAQIAQKAGIPTPTLYYWMKQAEVHPKLGHLSLDTYPWTPILELRWPDGKAKEEIRRALIDENLRTAFPCGNERSGANTISLFTCWTLDVRQNKS